MDTSDRSGKASRTTGAGPPRPHPPNHPHPICAVAYHPTHTTHTCPYRSRVRSAQKLAFVRKKEVGAGRHVNSHEADQPRAETDDGERHRCHQYLLSCVGEERNPWPVLCCVRSRRHTRKMGLVGCQTRRSAQCGDKDPWRPNPCCCILDLLQNSGHSWGCSRPGREPPVGTTCC